MLQLDQEFGKKIRFFFFFVGAIVLFSFLLNSEKTTGQLYGHHSDII